MTNSNYANRKKGKISEEVYKILCIAHDVRQGRSKIMTPKEAEKWTKKKVLSGETTLKDLSSDDSE